jgi:elongation factor Ts
VVAISAKEVKALRDQTGAGMMDCKQALTEADGKLDKAIEVLRERGLAKAGKRAGRETSEGTIRIAANGNAAAIIELGCETDFVAKTDDFQNLAREIAELVVNDTSITGPEQALAAKLADGTVEDGLKAAIAKLGENVQLKRVERISVDSGLAGGYVHAGGKLGVVVALDTTAAGAGLDTLARDLSMHIAAIDPTPLAIDREGVSAETVENERRILKNQALQSGKPEKVIDKIVEGRMAKFYSEHCLIEQGFVKDPDTRIGDLLKKIGSEVGGEVKVSAFQRLKLGEANPE